MDKLKKNGLIAASIIGATTAIFLFLNDGSKIKNTPPLTEKIIAPTERITYNNKKSERSMLPSAKKEKLKRDKKVLKLDYKQLVAGMGKVGALLISDADTFLEEEKNGNNPSLGLAIYGFFELARDEPENPAHVKQLYRIATESKIDYYKDIALFNLFNLVDEGNIHAAVSVAELLPSLKESSYRNEAYTSLENILGNNKVPPDVKKKIIDLLTFHKGDYINRPYSQ